jgi:iron complex outermembrane receptor protein
VRLASRITDSAAVSLDWNRSESSGFRDDTEFSTNTLRFSGRLDTSRGPVTLTLGYATRDFGAYAFYGTTFPNQQESTRTQTGRLAAELNFGKWTVTPSVAIRDHHDDFILDRNRPAFYRNIHDTLVPTGRLVFRRPVGTGILAAGAEAASEEITSTNLGDHNRSRTAVFMEFEQPLSKDANTRLGLRWDAFSDFSSRLSPQLSFSYGISRALKLRASGSTAFRVPTFTELYYFDPQTRGNPDLAPEKSWSVEAGARYEEKGFMLDGALFYRDSQDLIDYVRYAPGNPYVATNIRQAEFTGIELAAGVAFAQRSGARITRLDVHFSYLFFDLEKLSAEAGGALEGRYVLDPLRSKFHLALSGVLPFEVTATARASYFQRPSTQTPGPIFDLRLGRQLFEGQIIELFVDGLNLTDRTFEERAGVPLPGRTFHAGFQVTW